MGFRITEDTRRAESPHLSPQPFSQNYRSISWAKRTFDVLIAALALIFLAPLFLVVAVLIRLQDGGPAFFYHKRVGKYGQTFNCIKFRSMVPDAVEQLEQYLTDNSSARWEWDTSRKLTNDPRVTPIGRFLRKTSIDELPQLFNVLVGEMSLVGPRPIVEEEVSKYADKFKHYCSVSPGITGLWQVRGRSDTSYQTRVSLDVLYVETYTFWGDMKIIAMTIPVVLASRGAR